MTLPDVKDFPALPAGYTFVLSYRGVDPTYGERRFDLAVRDIGLPGALPLVMDRNFSEQVLLIHAKDLAKAARIAASTGDTLSEVETLNRALEEKATR